MNNYSPHFYNFLAEGNIICNLEAGNSVDAIEELTRRLVKNTGGLDSGEIIDAVVTREKVVPTVVAPGLAVPHARMDKVSNLLVALGTSRSGVNFNSPGMPPVNVTVLLLTPKDDPGVHLQVLAALAKDFRDPETVRKLAAMESPKEILNFFNSNSNEMPEYLRAKDIMSPPQFSLLESDTLHDAIETLAAKRLMEIPVLDEEGDLRGIIGMEDILKFSLPEHILWMDDLRPILRFQPFAEMLRDDQETKLADVMREEFVTVPDDIPAIQLAKIFLMEKVRFIPVVQGRQLVGVVSLHNFITKLFWA